jgi:hypothetical protein
VRGHHDQIDLFAQRRIDNGARDITFDDLGLNVQIGLFVRLADRFEVDQRVIAGFGVFVLTHGKAERFDDRRAHQQQFCAGLRQAHGYGRFQRALTELRTVQRNEDFLEHDSPW